MKDFEHNKRILLTAVKALETTFNCFTAVHDYSGQLRHYLPELPYYHLNPFCTTLKYKLPELTAACIAFDRNSVQKKLSGNPEPFLKYCHHGLTEAVIPLFIEGKLSGAMFIGPFVQSSKILPGNTLKATKTNLLPLLKTARKKLPAIDAEKGKKIFALGNLISSYIDNLVSADKASVYSSSSSRAEQIEAFINARFKENISLNDLARSLLLCESRTSQLVKSSFGKTFPELLTLRRLDHAKSLLENSRFSIEIVAAYSGYNDPAYFHRIFKKHTGLTPKQFRRQAGEYGFSP
ncbi:MAG: helix-turn-helix domain-containing protein [Victivallaceae bacterium]